MKPKTEELQTIDPLALAGVAGGKARTSSETDPAVMTALTGILDSLSSLSKSNQSSGFGAQEMMLFMMMMQQHDAPQVVAPGGHKPANWTWDAKGGYWIVK